MKKKLWKQAEYLLSGIIVWMPIIILAIIGGWTFNAAENIGKGILNIFPSIGALPKGTGFLLIIFFIYLSGILLEKTRARKFIAKIPIVGFFWGQKGTMMSIEKLLTLRPCLFLYTPTCPSFGFIFSKEKVTLNGEESSLSLLNVYYPNVPMLITGQTFPVRKEAVIKIGNTPKEIIDLLLYSSRSPENIKLVPWEDEKEEDFKKRAEKFGLNQSIN